MLLGRPIGPQDTATSSKAVVVNQTFANDYFPHGDAIGRSFTIWDPRVPGMWEIVGVVRDAKYSSAKVAPRAKVWRHSKPSRQTVTSSGVSKRTPAGAGGLDTMLGWSE